jgi:hypothetical protein
MDKGGFSTRKVILIILIVLFILIFSIAIFSYFYKIKIATICIPTHGRSIGDYFGEMSGFEEKIDIALSCEQNPDCTAVIRNNLESIENRFSEDYTSAKDLIPKDSIDNIINDIGYCENNLCFFREPYFTYTIVNIPAINTREDCNGREYNLRVRVLDLLIFINKMRTK